MNCQVRDILSHHPSHSLVLSNKSFQKGNANADEENKSANYVKIQLGQVSYLNS